MRTFSYAGPSAVFSLSLKARFEWTANTKGICIKSACGSRAACEGSLIPARGRRGPRLLRLGVRACVVLCLHLHLASSCLCPLELFSKPSGRTNNRTCLPACPSKGKHGTCGPASLGPPVENVLKRVAVDATSADVLASEGNHSCVPAWPSVRFVRSDDSATPTSLTGSRPHLDLGPKPVRTSGSQSWSCDSSRHSGAINQTPRASRAQMQPTKPGHAHRAAPVEG